MFIFRYLPKSLYKSNVLGRKRSLYLFSRIRLQLHQNEYDLGCKLGCKVDPKPHNSGNAEKRGRIKPKKLPEVKFICKSGIATERNQCRADEVFWTERNTDLNTRFLFSTLPGLTVLTMNRTMKLHGWDACVTNMWHLHHSFLQP